jgi:hypothetical protein
VNAKHESFSDRSPSKRIDVVEDGDLPQQDVTDEVTDLDVVIQAKTSQPPKPLTIAS